VSEENFWTSWCKGRLTEEDAPTIRLGATPSGLTSAHLHHPHPMGSSKYHTTTIVLRPFFQDHLGEPVPEENFWTLWCKGRLTEADVSANPAGRHSIRTNHCPPLPSSPYFYRPDALPAAEPTASKH